MSLRTELNNADPNRVPAALREVGMGDLLNLLLVGGDVVVPALTSTQNATANGSDAGTTQTLANALKVSYNALQVDVAALRTALLAAAGVTEAAVTVTANVATLAAQPAKLYAVVASAGTTTGMKKPLRGAITGPTALVPATGQAVWDGGKKVLFSTADVVTAANFLYSKDADTTASLLQRDVGEQD